MSALGDTGDENVWYECEHLSYLLAAQNHNPTVGVGTLSPGEKVHCGLL